MVKIGDAVVFVNRVGKKQDAIVTAVWGANIYPDKPLPSINVVIVSEDESKTDSYGRQIERETSIPHQTNQAAHGYYWREFNDESPLTPYSTSL